MKNEISEKYLKVHMWRINSGDNFNCQILSTTGPVPSVWNQYGTIAISGFSNIPVPWIVITPPQKGCIRYNSFTNKLGWWDGEDLLYFVNNVSNEN